MICREFRRFRRLWRRAGGAVLAGLAVLVTSCASLDATEDIARASDLVEARIGYSTNWLNIENGPESPLWDGVAPLTSDTAVRLALRKNRAIQREVETIIASRADVAQAHLLPNPVINLALGFPLDGMGGEPMSASVVQQLAAFWKRPARISRADAELQQRILHVSDAALRLVAEVRRSFADVAFAERGEALAGENVTLLEQALQPLRDRFSVGEASRLDVTRAEHALLTAQTLLTDRIRARTTAQRRLLALLGRAPADVTWKCDDAALAIDLTPPLPTEAEVIALTVTQRLDIAAARSASAARAAGLDLEDLNRFPDVSAGVEYQDMFDGREGVFPSVAVTPKIFDDNSAQRAKARSLYEQAVLSAEHVQETAIGEARSVWSSYASQRSVLARYDDEILPVVREQRDLARDAFSAGETDLTVLLDAERAFNAARLERLDRHHTATQLLYELERAVGGSLNTASIHADGEALLQPEDIQ